MLEVDVLVIGGGINGAGIARDAAGRGLSVLLCEKDDLASHTSSASTKLIHGGLRYLEYYEFGLVRKALQEREVLMRSAPHIISPLRFVMPHDKGQRPAWMIRAGLFLYDHLAKRELLPGAEVVNLQKHIAGQPLLADFRRGFAYSDGWVNDARLVVLNAMQAAEKGATIMTRTRCVSARRQDDHWLAQLQKADGSMMVVQSRSLVNASGPWAINTLQQVLHQGAAKHLRLIKGSHIVVQRLFHHPYAYIFQHPDGRIVFAIPYEQNFTLIGTTDLDYQGSLDEVAISEEEVSYLCGLASHYFTQSISPADVLWSYSGVRPLVEEAVEAGKEKAAALTRDYSLELDTAGAPLLNVFGGKITTYRKLAEEALSLLAPLLNNANSAWTEHACLPGGDIYGDVPENRAVSEFPLFIQQCQQQYAWLPPHLTERYAHAYGSRIHVLLKDKYSLADMGDLLLPGLYVAEAAYLVKHEWAREVNDILWRRSRLGLHLLREDSSRLQEWLDANAQQMQQM
ncbi:homodimeric glycerol 3-phosphate dehydrogenase (quinone) [Undibacterium pigrum]|uniref:Glycerol-3-phosphate dehydrogenase n=2 Tax=Undibacterium pigrum TaxID=401470 RepID=A0A318J493_9BURK|nr:homodimeric glycerol 3-phosphate dehydrogenase (quinone) [Undibacterium pigrum]